jgi:hypothetical protein
LLLYYYGYLRLLNTNVKKWNLHRWPQDPSIHKRCHPAFHPKTGYLDL